MGKPCDKAMYNSIYIYNTELQRNIVHIKQIYEHECKNCDVSTLFLPLWQVLLVIGTKYHSNRSVNELDNYSESSAGFAFFRVLVDVTDVFIFFFFLREGPSSESK